MDDWPHRWQGSWIWWDPAGAVDQLGYIRRTVVLEEVPKLVPARACANGRYVLYVNGERVGQGPIRAEPQCLSYDEYDLSPYLRPGPNAIAAWCRHYGEAVAFWRPTVPVGEVGAGWFVFEARIGADTLGTDESWRAQAAPVEARGAGLPGQPGAEVVRGPEVPRGWRGAGYDDADWPAARVLTWAGMGPPVSGPPADPHPAFHARPLPQLTDAHVLAARMVGAGTAAYEPTDSPLADFEGASVAPRPDGPVDGGLGAAEFATFDLGGEVFGRPTLRIEAEPGAVVDLSAGEDLAADGRPVVLPRNWVMRYHAAGRRPEEVEAFDAVGLRYLSVRASAPVRLQEVGVRETLYPRGPGAWFRSSDPDLDALWEAGARSVDLCSTDAYVDCPGREQRAWLGDAYIHLLVSLAANPDSRLVGHNLRLHAQNRRPDGLLEMFAGGDIGTYPYVIPDYSLHWIRAVARAWEHLGDEALLDELAPLSKGILDWFERFRGPDGLLTDVPSWVFVDWAQTARSSQTAALDALYVLALDDAAGLHDARGDRRSADECLGRAARSRDAFAMRYWDGERGLFVDAAGSRRLSQQTNALAVLAGLVPDGGDGAVMDAVLDVDRVRITKTPADSMDDSVRGRYQWLPPDDFDPEHDVVGAQPFFSHWVHQAAVRAGRGDRIDSLVRRWLPQLADGQGCFGEFWGMAPGSASRCHGWSATPTFDLTAHVAGIRPLAPGCTVVGVAPRLGGLSWLDVSMPVPKGFVRVVARAGAAPEVEAPPGVRVVLGVPE